MREGERQVRGTLLFDQGQPGFGECMQGTGEVAQHRSIEDRADGQFAPEAGANQRGQASGDEGMAAEMEEVVGQPRPLDTQKFGHQFAEQDLVGSGGRDVAGGEAEVLRRRESLAIELAVGTQGSASSTTNAAGTMYSGSRAASRRRRLVRSTA